MMRKGVYYSCPVCTTAKTAKKWPKIANLGQFWPFLAIFQWCGPDMSGTHLFSSYLIYIYLFNS